MAGVHTEMPATIRLLIITLRTRKTGVVMERDIIREHHS